MKISAILFNFLFLIIVLSSCQKASLPQSDHLWKPYSKEALRDAAIRHQPVVIDFFADWCPSCHDLDRTVFSLPEMQAKLSQVIALRMDATNQDDPKVQKILDEYGIEGLPTVVFLDRKGREIKDSRVIGLVTSKEFSQSMALLNIFK